MESRYDHQHHEPAVLRRWEDADAFRAPSKIEAEANNQTPFTIIMPPPNANDPLHIGHAMFVAIEDIFTRFQRMKGKAVLWLPGADHAGIETQYVYEKKLSKEGKSRFDFDRNTLYQNIWAYVQDNSDIAMDQIKRLGASADWSRFKFTLDQDVVNLVSQTFLDLDQKGFVYRAEKLVNYCTRCGTSYSELEVEYEEQVDELFFINYHLADEPEKFITLATVRPETMFADVAVAVYPDHPKYSEYLGRELIIPLTDKRIPVIADSAVDPEFGTGALKITPGHDQNDWDIWQKHQGRQLVHDDYTLAVDHRGKLTKNTPFAGRNVTEGRLQTVAQLEKEGFIQKRDPKYSHRVGHCYRCNRTIEPLPLPQFFLKTRKMADKALAAVNAKEVRVHGAGREAILKQWLENLKDWNISRQIVWGIRLPVWYKISQQDSLAVTWIDKKGQVKPQASLNTYLKQNHSLAEIEAGIQSLLALPNAEYVVSLERPGEDYIQETDTFDTWFSSGQWPVVALKTNQPGDFEYYYPTSLMETAYDILIFWVMRMLMLGIELTGKTPFSDVYLHGLIRDEKGLKMSKSKGNVINPLSLVDKYGADALRMALVMSSAPGQDKNVGENTIKGMRNFSNKIWNSARFVSGAEIPATGKGDEEFYLKLNEVITKIDDLLEDLKPGLAAETVYNEFWHWFCDDCIERGKNGQLGKEALNFGLQTFLKLLHPFAPFVTEAIWAELSLPGLLATSDWPTVSVKLKR